MSVYPAPYKLEKHLKTISDENPEYKQLYSTWCMCKDSCSAALKNINVNYPHYSEHDSSHSETVITNIEMLLGEERIKMLSPTTTWMILLSCYMHDFGMILLYDRIEEDWKKTEFQHFLKYSENSYNDEELAESVKMLKELHSSDEIKDLIKPWPLKVRKNVTYLNSCYYRDKHSLLSEDYILKMKETFKIDLEFNGLIQVRLIDILAEISSLHTKDFSEVMKLDYKTNGYNSDYLYPRFVAEMLRLGDLLDADNNRFNPYTELTTGKKPLSSDIHEKKHRSVQHLLITPQKIEFRANCTIDGVFRETSRFLESLERELNNYALNWSEIVPENFSGSAPKLTKKEILLNNQPNMKELVDLRFNISQEKAFDIIQGNNIYDDNKYVFLRELIQNALDAIKIQMWREIKTEYIERKQDFNNIQIFDLVEFLKNHKVEVEFKNNNDDYLTVIVSDTGTGITIEAFKEMCNVGENRSSQNSYKNEILEMPVWLRPTSGFGIGLQSVFLVTDKFDIFTKSESGSIHATIESRKRNGYVRNICNRR